MRQYFRAYNARSSRQQGADRLVYNETDLRTVLWQAVDPSYEGERPSTIRLAADIYLTKPIELGAYQYNVTIEGSDKYSIAHVKNYSGDEYLFGLPSGAISNLTFDGITFEVAGQLYSIFGGNRGGTVSELALYDCFTVNQNFAYATAVFDSTVNARGCDINAAAAFGFMFLGGSTFGGTITYATPLLGGTPTFEQKSTFGDIFSRGVSGVVCGNGATGISLTVDGGLKTVPNNSITLSGADPAIQVGNRTHFVLDVASSASGNLNLSHGQEGQIIILLFNVSVAHSLVLTDLSTTSAPNPLPGYAEIHTTKKNHGILNHDIVTFIYHNGEWCEMARGEGK